MEKLDLVLDASRERDADGLRDAVAALSVDKESAPILSKLLLEDWHDSHEDIVFELGLVGDPCAIGPIAQAILIPFDHLVQSGNLRQFQRKCAYALARIGTADSRAVLEDVAKNSDPILSAYGAEGLQKWPLPYTAPR